jgi:HSP20 family protein
MITPLRDINRLKPYERLGHMMEDLFDGERWLGFGRAWAPVVDIKDTDTEITFLVELPGLCLEDIDVEMADKVLTISGKRVLSEKDKQDNYIRLERAYGEFQRSFTVDVPVNPNRIEAHFKDGLLTVKLHKVESVQPHKVKVLTG